MVSSTLNTWTNCEYGGIIFVMEPLYDTANYSKE